MAEKSTFNGQPQSTHHVTMVSNAPEQEIGHDALRLAEMGYVQDLRRKFSVWSLLAIGFSLTNSWFGVSAGMVTGINSGGPVLLVYGLILLAIISVAVGMSLAELASAYPNAGGQYYWAKELASPRYAGIASYLTGWTAWCGSIFTSASISLAMGSAIMGMWQLTHPEFVIQPWHVVVTYQVWNFVIYFFNLWGRALPKITTVGFCASLGGFLIIIITVPACADSFQPSKFVFAEFINNTGWSSNAMAFLVGLINTSWPFAAIDCATHLAEEITQPERRIPLAILGTVCIGFVTSWLFSIAMMFSIVDLDTVSATPTLVPIIEIFNQAVNRAGAVGLEVLIVLTAAGCQVACHTWQARLCWSFARDNGLPFSTYLKRVNHDLDAPIIAHTASCFVDALIGFLYLGSSAALGSVITATITLLYISYSIPVICLLFRGRNNITHGPYWFGTAGLVSNWILLLWTVFSVVIFSFPMSMPAEATTMNYIAAVYAVIAIIVAIDWFCRASTDYQGQLRDRVQIGVQIPSVMPASHATSELSNKSI